MKKGDIYNGFQVLDVQEIPFLKATGIYYRNELRSIHKNGVKLQPLYEA